LKCCYPFPASARNPVWNYGDRRRGEIKTAIAQGDTNLLTKVSGVGKKTAERVILDLRDKVGTLAPAEGTSSSVGLRGDEMTRLFLLAIRFSKRAKL